MEAQIKQKMGYNSKGSKQSQRKQKKLDESLRSAEKVVQQES